MSKQKEALSPTARAVLAGALIATGIALIESFVSARGVKDYWATAIRHMLQWGFGPVALGAGIGYVVSGSVRHRDRMRRVKGLCGHCGYNLTGLTECRCPECGKPFTQRLNESLEIPSDEGSEIKVNEHAMAKQNNGAS